MTVFRLLQKLLKSHPTKISSSLFDCFASVKKLDRLSLVLLLRFNQRFALQ